MVVSIIHLTHRPWKRMPYISVYLPGLIEKVASRLSKCLPQTPTPESRWLSNFWENTLCPWEQLKIKLLSTDVISVYSMTVPYCEKSQRVRGEKTWPKHSHSISSNTFVTHLHPLTYVGCCKHLFDDVLLYCFRISKSKAWVWQITILTVQRTRLIVSCFLWGLLEYLQKPHNLTVCVYIHNLLHYDTYVRW